MNFDNIIVFTDGACSGNPGPGGWGAVFVMPKSGEVVELGAGAGETTNNRMEMIAVCRVLEELKSHDVAIDLYTDSVYVIRGITEWIFGWKRRGWRTAVDADVVNKDLWQWMDGLVRARTTKIQWLFVKGHSGVPGNERVDEIASSFAAGRRVDLYNGNLQRYDVAILDLPDQVPVPEIKKNKTKVKAYSYLSLVDGVLQKHSTWPECERRVKGRSGARFKKSISAEDEAAILKSWGVGGNGR